MNTAGTQWFNEINDDKHRNENRSGLQNGGIQGFKYCTKLKIFLAEFLFPDSKYYAVIFYRTW